MHNASSQKNRPLCLASTSPFRKALLTKLRLSFETDKPEIDETRLEGESIRDMVKRLSIAKAEKVLKSRPDHIIIASDQTATFEGQAIGKPHNYENATQQLNRFSGKAIEFVTGLAVLDNVQKKTFYHQDITTVHFRELSQQDIHNYLIQETPYQCAGSFKSEGLGISLFKKIESKDPNALIGLPLIALCELLRQLEIQIPPSQTN